MLCIAVAGFKDVLQTWLTPSVPGLSNISTMHRTWITEFSLIDEAYLIMCVVQRTVGAKGGIIWLVVNCVKAAYFKI